MDICYDIKLSRRIMLAVLVTAATIAIIVLSILLQDKDILVFCLMSIAIIATLISIPIICEYHGSILFCKIMLDNRNMDDSPAPSDGEGTSDSDAQDI